VRDSCRTVVTAVLLIIVMGGCAGSRTAPSADKAAATRTKPEEAKSPSAKDPKGYSEDVQRGDAAWQAQDFDRAIYFYVQAMDKSPDDAVTLAKIGTIEDARGNAALAERAFEMSHRANPEEPRVAERLARLYFKSGKVDNASEIYTQVLAADPNRARALDGMGEVNLTRSDYGQAILDFDLALKADKPDRAAVLTHRGYAKLRSRDLVGAEVDLRSALSVPQRDDTWIAPRDDAWRYLGDVLILRSDTAGALESLLNVMSTAEAFNEMGVTLMGVKNYKDAREYFIKAISASAAWFESAQKNLALVDERLRNTSG
jgi:tetratricopeptide (TPR) repeat protein